MGGGSSIPLDTRAGGQDDVEVMSTDSSSSSSSDSHCRRSRFSAEIRSKTAPDCRWIVP
ncbi:mediator complex subunit [Culex quinquefasciatus]|uniref:Mediator complex subunit n=1 Tax=Culex quinquefasciatus TaxID=7176 RepID=B0W6L1_CULQU|nr:mediator complex subunit [Culex quinquefasciatus]|eukprot:XP_001844345.1 mediator complex subunit [Culex quinquefasciatus]